jgi:hypothetical protein
VSTNTAFWAAMVTSVAIIGYGIYDSSLLEVGIGVVIIAITIIGTLISDRKQRKGQ